MGVGATPVRSVWRTKSWRRSLGDGVWRRRRDSNPRYGFRPYNGLANRRLQPLGHVSGTNLPIGHLGTGQALRIRAASGQTRSDTRARSAVLAGGRLARALIEQNRAHLRIRHVNMKGRFDLHRQTSFDCRTRQHGFEPAPDVWKSAQVVAVALRAARPTDAGDIGDRVGASEELAVLEPLVDHAVKAVHLV